MNGVSLFIRIVLGTSIVYVARHRNVALPDAIPDGARIL